MSARRSTRHTRDLTTPEVSKIAHSTPPHSPHHRLLVGNPSGQGPPLVDWSTCSFRVVAGGIPNEQAPQRLDAGLPDPDRASVMNAARCPSPHIARHRDLCLQGSNKNTRHRLTVGPRGPAGTHEHPRLSPAPGSAAPRSAGTARTATSGHQRQKASGHIVVMHNSDATPVVPSKMSQRGDDTGRASHRGPPPAHLTRDPTT